MEKPEQEEWPGKKLNITMTLQPCRFNDQLILELKLQLSPT